MLSIKLNKFLALAVLLINCRLVSLHLKSNQSRIVGGTDAAVGQFPYQVSLQFTGNIPICSGAILNENYIITAAHCVVPGKGLEPYPARYLRVRVGSIQRTAGGQLLSLKRIVVHEYYQFYWYDLALLQLATPLKWTDKIQPVPLPLQPPPIGVQVPVAGWGQISAEVPHSHRLQWTTLETLSDAACDFADVSILCLAHTSGNGICFSDGGAPAVSDGELIGLAGHIMSDCGSKYPDGFTKIYYHRGWIIKVIQN